MKLLQDSVFVLLSPPSTITLALIVIFPTAHSARQPILVTHVPLGTLSSAMAACLVIFLTAHHAAHPTIAQPVLMAFQ